MKKNLFVFSLMVLIGSFLFSQDSETSEMKKRQDTLLYGMESDVISLIDTLISEKDEHFSDDLIQMFNQTNNLNIKSKIIYYLAEFKNESLKDYALQIIEDPYDENSELVKSVLKYIEVLEIKEAAPFALEILKTDSEEFFDSALSVIGKIGGVEESKYLIEYLHSDDISLVRKQSLMKAIGQLHIVETYDDLVEIINDTDENLYVRMYAIEAVSKMEKEEAIKIFVDLFNQAEPLLKTSIVKAAGNFKDDRTKILILDALKDNNTNVRMQAVKIARQNKMIETIPYLIFRANNDTDVKIKYECYYALASINDSEGNKFLSSIIMNKKINETSRAKACDAVLEYTVDSCYNSIESLISLVIQDTKLKNLRYAIGKSLAKKPNSAFENVCKLFLTSKDVATLGTGLDIFLCNKYPGLLETVKTISQDDKAGVNKKKALLILEKLSIK